MTFVKTETGWACEADDSFPLDQDKAQAMAQVLETLSADKTIDSPSTDKTYGLDAPKCTVTFENKTLKIGSDAAMDGGRYFSLGDGKVYITSADILSPFQYAMLDLVELQEAPMMENLSQVTLERKDGGTLVLRERQGENLSYSQDYIWFYGDKPLDTENTEALNPPRHRHDLGGLRRLQRHRPKRLWLRRPHPAPHRPLRHRHLYPGSGRRPIRPVLCPNE